MTSNINLTLDEIIQKKRGQQQGRGQANGRTGPRNKRVNGRKIPMNQSQTIQKKKDLRFSLASRLSRGRGNASGFKIQNADLQRSNWMPNRLGLSSGGQRISVYNRLTLNRITDEPQYRSRTQFQNRPAPVQRSLKTKNAEDSQPVRITNGAIVKGLRSDQLLLQKLNQRRHSNLQAKIEQLRASQMQRSLVPMRRERREYMDHISKVSMNHIDRSLTVSIDNEDAKRARSAMRMRPPRYASPPPSSISSTEDDYSPAPPPLPPPSRANRRFTEEVKDQAAPPSLLRLGLERPPPPKPHRQVLDSQIQKEISALQGYDEPHSGGPGPGVKGFRMVPNKTTHSLNGRFTMERSVIE